jgi:site-specific DNA-methyltransferase (adenine-specific)
MDGGGRSDSAGVGEVGQVSFDLRLGDCLEGMATLPDKSVDHVITDPPYEAEAHTEGRRIKPRGWQQAEGTLVITKALDFAPITEGQRQIACHHFARTARRWVIVFCQVEAVAAWRDALVMAGLSYRRTCAYLKIGAQPQLSGDRPGMGYESIVCAHAPGRSRWNGGGKVGVYESPRAAIVEGRTQLHMTEKPLGLMEALVRDFTDPGELILDPFAGSGTTGVAAIRNGRRFLGWERDPKFHAVASKRLAGAREQLTLFGVGR